MSPWLWGTTMTLKSLADWAAPRRCGGLGTAQACGPMAELGVLRPASGAGAKVLKLL